MCRPRNGGIAENVGERFILSRVFIAAEQGGFDQLIGVIKGRGQRLKDER